jgi:hypothetical protein
MPGVLHGEDDPGRQQMARFSEDRYEAGEDEIDSRVFEPEQDHADLGAARKRDDLGEVEVEGEQDSLLALRFLKNFSQSTMRGATPTSARNLTIDLQAGTTSSRVSQAAYCRACWMSSRSR